LEASDTTLQELSRKGLPKLEKEGETEERLHMRRNLKSWTLWDTKEEEGEKI